MNLAARLWDNAMDVMLERATGHKFDRGTDVSRGGGLCKKCSVLCLDVMDDFKAARKGGKPLARCPKENEQG